MYEKGGILWKSLESSQTIILTIIMTIISLLSLYKALHSHAQLSVVMRTWLTNVCADPNSESACVTIFNSTVFQSELLRLKWSHPRILDG